MAALTRSATLLRMAANRTARRAVVSARGQGLLLALGAWINAETWLEGLDGAQVAEIQRPVSGFAQTVLDAALKRVRKRGRHFANLAPPELHRLRIAAKQLRYATEFFAPLHEPRWGPSTDSRDLDHGAGRQHPSVVVGISSSRAPPDLFGFFGLSCLFG